MEGWFAHKAGRNILVQSVLTSMLIYLLLALDLPAKALEAIDKIRRGFLWKGRKDVKGGHCLIAWPNVTRPPWLRWSGHLPSIVSRLGSKVKVAMAPKNWTWQTLGLPPGSGSFTSKSFFLLYPLPRWWEMERIPYFGQIDGCLGKGWIRHSLICLG